MYNCFKQSIYFQYGAVMVLFLGIDILVGSSSPLLKFWLRFLPLKIITALSMFILAGSLLRQGMVFFQLFSYVKKYFFKGRTGPFLVLSFFYLPPVTISILYMQPKLAVYLLPGLLTFVIPVFLLLVFKRLNRFLVLDRTQFLYFYALEATKDFENSVSNKFEGMYLTGTKDFQISDNQESVVIGADAFGQKLNVLLQKSDVTETSDELEQLRDWFVRSQPVFVGWRMEKHPITNK